MEPKDKPGQEATITLKEGETAEATRHKSKALWSEPGPWHERRWLWPKRPQRVETMVEDPVFPLLWPFYLPQMPSISRRIQQTEMYWGRNGICNRKQSQEGQAQRNQAE